MNTTPGLSAITEAVLADPGLVDNITAGEIRDGADAADLMNEVLMTAIEATGVNDDGRLTPEDLETVSDYIRNDPDLYAAFVEGHGDDEGNEETGFHLVQGDGGTLVFQGRPFLNTVADAIYHIGFEIRGDRFVNEDGDDNELVEDVAGWLNYFVNGKSVVYGDSGRNTLFSGDYSTEFDGAEDELFLAGAGSDKVWAGDGHDKVRAGSGHDQVGGGDGRDTLFGGNGNDKLWGQDGHDSQNGQKGDDTLGGGNGNDKLKGGIGNDKLWGEAGDDNLDGGKGRDHLGGGEGNDTISGKGGHDTMGGDDGRDHMMGGAGNDSIWAGAGNDRIDGGNGRDKIGGQDGNDRIDAGEGRDTVWGGEGNDKISGGQGNDLLSGDAGDDTIDGGRGNDTLNGGEGDDVITGGRGADELVDWSDNDADTFVFSQGDVGVGAEKDVIKGFVVGTDKIDLTGFGGLTYAGNGFTGNGPEVVIDDRDILIDIDGDGGIDGMIRVEWVDGLSESDLLL